MRVVGEEDAFETKRRWQTRNRLNELARGSPYGSSERCTITYVNRGVFGGYSVC